VKRTRILIISNPQDEHTKRVYTKLTELAAEPILFFPEELGQGVSLSMSTSDKDTVFSQSLLVQAKQFSLDTISSVWYRRPKLVSLNEYNLSTEGLDFARDEWRATLESVYALLDHCLWVSHPDNLRKAARKPIQLLLAKQLGFAIPRTLITNNPNDAKAFVDLCDGKVIVKASGSGWVYSPDGKEVTYVLTNRLQATDVQHIGEIQCSPVVFQEEVPKAYEIRVNVIGQKVLAIKIDSQRSEISQVDWRRYDVEKTPYTAYQLPLIIEQKCLKLTQSLGLEFSALDLICRPDGEYVFLETNGNGQFLWAEELSGVAVSEALAFLLAGISPSLREAYFI